jgi:hypothetical protein
MPLVEFRSTIDQPPGVDPGDRRIVEDQVVALLATDEDGVLLELELLLEPASLEDRQPGHQELLEKV